MKTPSVGIIYSTAEEARNTIRSHLNTQGHSCSHAGGQAIKSFKMKCSSHGISCPFSCLLERTDEDEWELIDFDNVHNHEPVYEKKRTASGGNAKRVSFGGEQEIPARSEEDDEDESEEDEEEEEEEEEEGEEEEVRGPAQSAVSSRSIFFPSSPSLTTLRLPPKEGTPPHDSKAPCKSRVGHWKATSIQRRPILSSTDSIRTSRRLR